MLSKLGIFGALGLLASMAALYWLEPQTAGGQALVTLVVFAIVGGIGQLVWPKQS
jgi:hypothetical protein